MNANANLHVRLLFIEVSNSKLTHNLNVAPTNRLSYVIHALAETNSNAPENKKREK